MPLIIADERARWNRLQAFLLSCEHSLMDWLACEYVDPALRELLALAHEQVADARDALKAADPLVKRFDGDEHE